MLVRVRVQAVPSGAQSIDHAKASKKRPRVARRETRKPDKLSVRFLAVTNPHRLNNARQTVIEAQSFWDLAQDQPLHAY